MTLPEIKIISVLICTLLLFLWGKWRHDVVALFALILCVALGLVSTDTAFLGFGHPAVITVAAVLVMSASLQITGAIDVVTHKLTPSGKGPITTIASLTGLATVLSAFMNNVGAMALLMPIAIQLANKLGIPAGRVLMPVAFGSILGGMTTLIGTPPNLIVSGFRAEALGSGYRMFDFAPVGVFVALTGVVFIALIGWHFVPKRERNDAEGFDIGKYLTEVLVSEGGQAEGMTVRELDEALQESDAEVIGLVRGKVKVVHAQGFERLSKGDLIVIKAEPESLSQVLNVLGLRLVDNVKPPEKEEKEESADGGNVVTSHVDEEFEYRPPWFDRKITAYDRGAKEKDPRTSADSKSRASDNSEIVLVELVVMPDSRLINSTAADLRLRSRYGLNLLAISHEGNQKVRRLRRTKVQAGNVLLMQGNAEALSQFAANFNCVPLAERTVRVPSKKRAMYSTLIMISAVALAATGVTSAAVAFMSGVLLTMLLRVIPIRQIYESIDWSVVVLLAALIPVAVAFAETGAADTIAQYILNYLSFGSAVVALGMILVLTMFISDVMNNAATAAVMCPIALSSAAQLGVNPDAYLMAVAVGASCAFLTPIGHQNNTLILGPGGFKFGDYWRLGLPLEIIVVAVSIPALLYFWPL